MKRSRRFLIFVLVGLVLLVVGGLLASRGMSLAANSFNMDARYAVPAPTSVPEVVMYAGTNDGLLAQEQQAQTGQDRLVIRNAVLTLVVDDPDARLDEISALAAEYGGWVVSANAYRSGTDDEARVTSASISIRVLAERLDEALARLKANVESVEYENITGQDVTQDYVDLNSRLTNLQSAEQQLQEIMDSARRTEDVLSVYTQLVDIRGQIELIQGQMQYYEQSAAYATIQITLQPTPVTEPLAVGGWRPQETARNAFQSFIDLLQGVADIAIAVAVFGLPVLLVFGLPAWLIYRRYRKTRRPAAAVS